MVCVTLAAVVMALTGVSAPNGANLAVEPSFEQVGGWEPVGAGFERTTDRPRSGQWCIRCSGETMDSVSGARQIIVLDPPVQEPIRVSAWSRASRAVVGQDYNVYVDVIYSDGTPLWGVIASFEPGTHGWRRAEAVVYPTKPIRQLGVHLLFRRAAGTVWFDDVTVEREPFALDAVRIIPGLFGDGLGVSARTSTPADWQVSAQRADRTETTLATGSGQVMRAVAGGIRDARTVHVVATDHASGETARWAGQVPPAPLPQSRPYAVWTEDSMVRVLPSALPERISTHPTASISLARGESESFQVVVLPRPGAGLRRVRLDLHDLAGALSRAAIPSAAVEWQAVGYVRVEKLRGHPAAPDDVPGWWPDPLLPVEAVDVPGDFAQALWVTVHAPSDARAGDYRGVVRVVADGVPGTDVSVDVRVYPFSLPTRPRIKTAFALMDGYLEREYGKPLSPSIRRAFGDFVLAHGLNPDDISRTDPPDLADLEHYRDRGLNAFNVLNMVEERGERTWVCWSPPEVYTPEFKRHIAERLDPYVAALRTVDLTRWAYIYTFDERGEEFYPVIRDFFGMVKQRYPEIRTLTTSYVPLDPNVLDDLHIDWACPLTPRYDRAAADACRAGGHEVWAYVCLGPGYPYANWLADNPLVEARAFWWQAFDQRMDGVLYWGLNIWDRAHNERPIDPVRGQFLDWSITTGGDYDWLHGDGELLYPGVAGPIGSIRLANIRDGIEDLGYLALLEDQHPGMARHACAPVTTGLTRFTRDPATVRAQRDAVARRLAP